MYKYRELASLKVFNKVYTLSLASVIRITLRHVWRNSTCKLCGRDRRNLQERIKEDWANGMIILETRAGMELFASAVWTSWPLYHPFDGQTSVYQALVAVCPAWTWGLWFYLLAAAGAFSYFSGNYACRKFVSNLILFTWCGVSGLVIYEQVPGWVPALCPVIVLAESMRNVRISDKRKRLTR